MQQPKNNGNKNGDGFEERLNKIEKIIHEKDAAELAHKEADHDIEEDPDLSLHSPNDDLDEGETARLGEDRTDLV